MASYRDLLSETKAEIDEIDAADARTRLDDGETVFVDVRERAEWDEGHIPGAVHIPRGSLESRIEGLLPDRARPLVVLCAGGSRSAFAAKTLGELGYARVESLRGGFTDWKRNGFPFEVPRRPSRPRNGAVTPATCSSPRSARRARRSSSARACC